MIEAGAGIILRTLPLTETSLIVHWIGPTFGRIATVAKGARRPKSPFSGKLDLFYEADISFSRSRTGDLHTLREASLRHAHAPLRKDLDRLRQAADAALFIVRATEPETPLPNIHDLFKRFLESLSAETPSPLLAPAFKIRMLAELGLEPDWKHAKLQPGTAKIAVAMLQRDFESIRGLRPTEKQRAELDRFLRDFIIFHLDAGVIATRNS